MKEKLEREEFLQVAPIHLRLLCKLSQSYIIICIGHQNELEDIVAEERLQLMR